MKMNDLKLFKVLESGLGQAVPLAPHNKKIGIVVLREFASTSVLTTEGQALDVELVRAGDQHSNLVSRVVLQKRKQIAPERRNGRAFNRHYDLADEKCKYMEEMCGKCPDCIIYGFAATSGEGSQRARVLTDSAFSIREYEHIQRSITLNAIEDTTKGGVSGSAFAEREHVRPQVYFPTIETLVDVTSAEFLWILRNILTTSRYGAESSRQGYVHNYPVALVVSDTEITSNLRLTQRIYDQYIEKHGADFSEFPLDREEVQQMLLTAIYQAQEEAYAPVIVIDGEQLENILSEVRHFLKDEEGVGEWLKQLQLDHEKYLNIRKKK